MYNRKNADMLFKPESIEQDGLLHLDASQTLVLCISNRYARRIIQYISNTLSADQPVIAIPDVLPWGAWVGKMLDYFDFEFPDAVPQHVLGDFEAYKLWQQIISTTLTHDEVLLNTRLAARLAYQAYCLMDEWQIRVEDHEKTAEYEQFMRWRSEYLKKIKDSSLEDSALQFQRLCSFVGEKTLSFPYQTVVLAGFDEFSPRALRLLEQLQSQGVCFLQLKPAATPSSYCQYFVCTDSQQEWRQAAAWARQQLDENPQSHYAIIAPHLQEEIALAHRVLQSELAPHNYGFNISAAPALASWPLVQAALAWLRVLALAAQSKPIPVQDFGKALLSGWCAHHWEEQDGRIRCDVYLREKAILVLEDDEITNLLQRFAPSLAQAWVQALWQAQDKVQEGPVSAYTWRKHLGGLLQALGFPGTAQIDSVAWQTLEAIEQLFDGFSRLSVVSGKMSLLEATNLLTQLAQETLFQPQQEGGVRLDVLGLLDAEGGRWDGVWIMGMTNEVLPSVPSPNPFLPLVSLRRANAPRATAERELQWAKTVAAWLPTLAPEVCFSYASHEGERTLLPTSLLAVSVWEELEWKAAVKSGLEIQYIDDSMGPAVTGEEAIKGGVAVIDTQARNPLWAFACYRLGATALPAYALVPMAALRGNYLHALMQSFWQSCSNLHELHVLIQADELKPRLKQLATEVAKTTLTAHQGVLRELEIKRAIDIAWIWLQNEAQRPFFEVAGVEIDKEWQYKHLRMTLRIDRIDIQDQKKLLIDYKSGRQLPKIEKHWARDRLIDLQLPLYASILESDISALLLVQLHAKQCKVVGICELEEGIGLDGVAGYSSWPLFKDHPWKNVLASWRQNIETLADEFLQGHAENKTENLDDLRYCDLHAFLAMSSWEESDD